MSTDKEEFALYCEAKMTKSENARIKGGFYWTTAKKLSVAISRCITAMDDNDYDEDDFKNPSASICPLLTTFRQKACLIRNSATAMKKAGKMASQ